MGRSPGVTVDDRRPVTYRIVFEIDRLPDPTDGAAETIERIVDAAAGTGDGASGIAHRLLDAVTCGVEGKFGAVAEVVGDGDEALGIVVLG